MGRALARTSSWRGGYGAIACIQLALFVVLLASLPLWRWHQAQADRENTDRTDVANNPGKTSKRHVLRIPGVTYALATFLFYCAAEAGVGLWGSSFLVQRKGIPVETAAFWVAVYFGGITLGRFRLHI